jgi:DNA-binding protein HU-beta
MDETERANSHGCNVSACRACEKSWKKVLTLLGRVGRRRARAGRNSLSTPSFPETKPQINQSEKIVIQMNKAELVESVQKSLGKDASKAHAERAVEAVIDGIKASLKKGKAVQLVGFGTFKVVQRKARTGVNPKTGEKIKIKASKNVKFSAGKDLKSKL